MFLKAQREQILMKTRKFKSWGAFYGKGVTPLREFLGNYHHTELFEAVLKFKPKAVLEVGAGSGVMGILLSHLGCKTTSVDNDKAILAKAKQNNNQYSGSVKYVFGDAFKLPFKNNTFDVAYSQGLFEHF